MVKEGDEVVQPTPEEVIATFLSLGKEANPLAMQLKQAVEARRNGGRMRSAQKALYFSTMMQAAADSSLQAVVMANLELDCKNSRFHDKKNSLGYKSHTAGLAIFGLALTLRDCADTNTSACQSDRMITDLWEKAALSLAIDYRKLTEMVSRSYVKANGNLESLPLQIPLQLLVRIAEYAASQNKLGRASLMIISNFHKLTDYFTTYFEHHPLSDSLKQAIADLPNERKSNKGQANRETPASITNGGRKAVLYALSSHPSLESQPSLLCLTLDVPGDCSFYETWEELIGSLNHEDAYLAATQDAKQRLNTVAVGDIHHQLLTMKSQIPEQVLENLPDSIFNTMILHGVMFKRAMSDEENHNPDLMSLIFAFNQFMEKAKQETATDAMNLLLHFIGIAFFKHCPLPGKRRTLSGLREASAALARPFASRNMPAIRRLADKFFRGGKVLAEKSAQEAAGL